MNITLATLEKLCRALNCTPNDLLEFDPPLASDMSS
jgi:DNA-binding Xre family transcriptional regulator